MFATVVIFPGSGLYASDDCDALAFGEVLRDEFGSLAPRDNIDIVGLVAIETAVDGQGERRDGRSLW